MDVFDVLSSQLLAKLNLFFLHCCCSCYSFSVVAAAVLYGIHIFVRNMSIRNTRLKSDENEETFQKHR